MLTVAFWEVEHGDLQMTSMKGLTKQFVNNFKNSMYIIDKLLQLACMFFRTISPPPPPEPFQQANINDNPLGNVQILNYCILILLLCILLLNLLKTS